MRNLTPVELIYVSGGLQLGLIQVGGGGINSAGAAGSVTGAGTLGSTNGNSDASAKGANGGIKVSIRTD